MPVLRQAMCAQGCQSVRDVGNQKQSAPSASPYSQSHRPCDAGTTTQTAPVPSTTDAVAAQERGCVGSATYRALGLLLHTFVGLYRCMAEQL